MKAQISRESHRPSKRYSGVYHIQGAMVTDADLDERSVITRERTDNLGDDTIRDGVPEIGGLTPRDVQVMVRSLQGMHLVGGDICEVAPCFDPTGITCVTAANLMWEMLCVLADSKAIRS